MLILRRLCGTSQTRLLARGDELVTSLNVEHAPKMEIKFGKFDFYFQKKYNVKHLKPHAQEIAPEPSLKAPPPTPCISLKQRSGSVPDVRIVDSKKEKSSGGSYCKGLFQTFACAHKVVPRPLVDFDPKRSTSEHSMATAHLRTSPCTSNLLHSVRQRLMNL